MIGRHAVLAGIGIFVFSGPLEAVSLPPLPVEYESAQVASVPNSAVARKPAPIPLLRHKGGKFDFQFVKVSQLVSLLYSEATVSPYVLSPEILEDERMVSFRYDVNRGQLASFLRSFLESLGYEVISREGVNFIRPRNMADEEKKRSSDVHVYHPRYRDAHYLARQVQPLFEGAFTSNRAVATKAPLDPKSSAPDGSAAAAIDQHSDTLIFHGLADEITRLQKLLPLIDTPAGEVAIKAVAYEVTHTDETGSAFHAAIELLGQGVTIGAAGGKGIANALTFKARGAEAVFSALSQDARFKAINAPNLRIRSGARGRLTIGQKVPILGAVTYPRGAGQPIQSVEYHSSGVIFELRPVVKESVIDVHVTQQISDFVKTTTGVNNSPTLNTREVMTDICVEDGDVVVLGGLTTDKDVGSRAGLSFLPRFLDGKAQSNTKTEILLVLHVEKV